MKRIFIVVAWVLAIVAALMLSSQADAGTVAGGKSPVHQGFYFNVGVAPAAGHYHFTGPGANMDVHGGAADVDFRFGYAVTRHLILSLDLSGMATVNNPDTTLNGYTLRSSSDYHFGSALSGLGLTWYFDNNLFLGLTAGTGQISLHYNNTDINSNNGFGTQIRFGREWWVGHDWGLGIVGGLDYVTAGTDTHIVVIDPYGNVYTAYFDHADATTLFVGFTATFN
jgi:hypothetical protein